MIMFDSHKVATVIDEVYHIMNIQYSLVVFDEADMTSDYFKQFLGDLESRDFPYIVYGNDTHWSSEVFDEHIITKRMFLVPYQYLGRFMDLWRVNFENINFLIWLSHNSKNVFDALVPYYKLKLPTNCIRLLVAES